MQFRSEYEGPRSRGEPVPIIKTGDWRFQRPETKIEKCCHCGWCYLVCPSMCAVDKGTYFTANLDFCKGCGICAKECPVNAIIMIRER